MSNVTKLPSAGQSIDDLISHLEEMKNSLDGKVGNLLSAVVILVHEPSEEEADTVTHMRHALFMHPVDLLSYDSVIAGLHDAMSRVRDVDYEL